MDMEFNKLMKELDVNENIADNFRVFKEDIGIYFSPSGQIEEPTRIKCSQVI